MPVSSRRQVQACSRKSLAVMVCSPREKTCVSADAGKVPVGHVQVGSLGFDRKEREVVWQETPAVNQDVMQRFTYVSLSFT